MKFPEITVFLILIAGCAVAEELVIRETKQGKVRGRLIQVENSTVEEYRNIPFAESPVGNLRFKPPQPRAPWSGIHNATGDGTACPQPSIPALPMQGVTVTEDCLHLNVWAPTPDTTTRVPVYVWIHGGGFSIGTAAQEGYNGSYFAAKTGLVVVSMNYRLGVLGFLNTNSSDAPGNVGLLDQQLALKWVQENIEYFGGDPTTVTISGESAGAVSVHAHVLSPTSQGLYKRAVIMSGTINTADLFNAPEEGMKIGNDVAKRVGCSHDGEDLTTHAEQILSCLRQKTADELVVAATQVSLPKLFSFFPTYSDPFLPYSPLEALERGLFNNVDILTGTTSDEGVISLLFPKRSEFLGVPLPTFEKEEIKRTVYGTIERWTKSEAPGMVEYYESRAPVGDAKALMRAYLDYLSDKLFNCPLQYFTEKHSARGNAVYRYIFGQKWRMFMLPEWMGSPHGTELYYVFGGPLTIQTGFSEEDRTVAKDVIEAIASFCKYGVPNLPSVNTWRTYTAEAPASMFIVQNNYTEVNDYRQEECERWRRHLQGI